MTAPVPLVELLGCFVQCFTQPGFLHFQHFIVAHAGLWGAAHCVTETLRVTLWHRVRHWTTPYVFMNHGRWSCREVTRRLLALLLARLGVKKEVVVALDDTLVKKWGRHFFGLGCYVDPTDKNPGASRRRVWGLCWVMLALLWERRPGQWLCFPLRALLFVPQKVCPTTWRFATKIELAVRLIGWLQAAGSRVIVVVDNLYAKAALAEAMVGERRITLVSRLRSNAALYELPPPRRPGQRGRTAVRGKKVTARQLYRRRSRCQRLKVHIYGKTVTIRAFVGIVMPSRTLGDTPVLAIIFPQRGGKKMNIFFTTDLGMTPVRLLELYAARFKIEDAFDELKTHGGFGDCRQRSFTAQRRHVTLCLLAYSLLRLLSATLRRASAIEAEPWWHPAGPPSVTRLRRAVAKSLRISSTSWSDAKPAEIHGLARAA
jgi:hypothetical protein